MTESGYSMSRCHTSVEALLKSLAGRYEETWVTDAAGISRQGKQIPALVHKEAYVDQTNKHRVLVIGGLTGKAVLSEICGYFNRFSALKKHWVCHSVDFKCDFR